MDRLIIETSDSPEILINKVLGTLRIKGWDRPQIRADMEMKDTLKAETDGNKITISCTSGCLLRVPNHSSILIEKVGNDLVIKSVDGAIKVKQVNGQVMVKSIGAFSADKIAGNLNAKLIEANIECRKIAGSAGIQDVDGKIILERVNGNLSISGFSTGLAANTSGNANLRLEPEPDGDYSVTAAGNIAYRLEPFTNAQITMKSKAGQIRLNIPEERGKLDSHDHKIILGDGDSRVHLEASGNIEIFSAMDPRTSLNFGSDFDELNDLSSLADDISQMVTYQIETQMDSISQHIQDLTSNLSSIDVSTARNQHNLEAKRRGLERKVSAFERKAQQKAWRAENRLERRLRVRTKPVTSEPVSDEERNKVLEMLQNKQISVAEAEILLSALEGRKPESVEKPDASSEIESTESNQRQEYPNDEPAVED